MELKDRIKNLRLEHDLTLDDVAKVVGVSRQTIQRYESGVISNIPSDKIELLAKALNTSPGALMGWESQESYYTNPETAKLAQEAFENPDVRILLDTSRDLAPEDLKFVIDMIEKLRNRH